jgi:hypothetical protein
LGNVPILSESGILAIEPLGSATVGAQPETRFEPRMNTDEH